MRADTRIKFPYWPTDSPQYAPLQAHSEPPNTPGGHARGEAIVDRCMFGPESQFCGARPAEGGVLAGERPSSAGRWERRELREYPFGSHDLEDIFALLAARPSTIAGTRGSPVEVREFLVKQPPA